MKETKLKINNSSSHNIYQHLQNTYQLNEADFQLPKPLNSNDKGQFQSIISGYKFQDKKNIRMQQLKATHDM